MTQKINIAEVRAFEGDDYFYTDEFGPAAYAVPCVTAVDSKGQHWTLPNDIRTAPGNDGEVGIKIRFDLFTARKIADKVNERGWIDADHWTMFEPDTSTFEDRMNEAYLNEMEHDWYGDYR